MKAHQLKVFVVSSNPEAGALWNNYLQLNEKDLLFHWKNGTDALENLHSIYPHLIIIDHYFAIGGAGEINEQKLYYILSGLGNHPPLYFLSPQYAVLHTDTPPVTPGYCSNMSNATLKKINTTLNELRWKGIDPDRQMVA